MTLVYLDTETLGLDPERHEVWEIAYALDDGPIQSSIVHHEFTNPDPAALRVNRYLERTNVDRNTFNERAFEYELKNRLHGATLVGANPAFDAAFLRKRWGRAPWRYRLLDVEAYAMGALGYDEPKGLARIREDLVRNGLAAVHIPEPDHTAARDVECLRACHLALRDIYQGIHTPL